MILVNVLAKYFANLIMIFITSQSVAFPAPFYWIPHISHKNKLLQKIWEKSENYIWPYESSIHVHIL